MKKIRKFTSLIMFACAAIQSYAQCVATGYEKITQGNYYTASIKTDGTLWVWGYNVTGIGGTGTTSTSIKHPQQVGTDADWKDVSAGWGHIVALKTDGTLWVWGQNAQGQLGLGNNTNVYVPTQVAGTYKAIATGKQHTLVIKTDGTMWGSGYNDWGGLGIGTSTNVNTFKQAGTDTDWSSMAGGQYHSLAIKNDGTLWAAGSNIQGQSGTGSFIGENDDFIQIGMENNWKQVAAGQFHSIALKTTGSVWTWGSNVSGELGTGTFGGYINTPGQVGTDINWRSVGAGDDNSFALKSNNTLWGFGNNDYGKLGNDSTIRVNVPTQINSETNWKTIPVNFAYDHSAVIKSDNSVWSWGWDGSFELGNGDGVAVSVPYPTQTMCSDNLAVEDITPNTTQIYPNPAKENISVKLSSGEKISSINIYDISGKLVKNIPNPNDNKIYVGNLSSGIYFIKINGNSQNLRFIKK